MSVADDDLEALLARVPVIPVLTVERVDTAAALARALADGGLTVLEVTLRTPAAVDAMRAMIAAVPDAAIGAGTVLDAGDLRAVSAAGARFAVSPGATPALLAAAATSRVPLLPGAATPSEVMALRERGHRLQKWFPAASLGGAASLRALGGPLADVRFCPTGGITAALAPDYLDCPNVVCVGGSWVAPRDAVEAGDWDRVTALAAAAAALGAPRA